MKKMVRGPFAGKEGSLNQAELERAGAGRTGIMSGHLFSTPYGLALASPARCPYAHRESRRHSVLKPPAPRRSGEQRPIRGHGCQRVGSMLRALPKGVGSGMVTGGSTISLMGGGSRRTPRAGAQVRYGLCGRVLTLPSDGEIKKFVIAPRSRPGKGKGWGEKRGSSVPRGGVALLWGCSSRC